MGIILSLSAPEAEACKYTGKTLDRLNLVKALKSGVPEVWHRTLMKMVGELTPSLQEKRNYWHEQEAIIQHLGPFYFSRITGGKSFILAEYDGQVTVKLTYHRESRV